MLTFAIRFQGLKQSCEIRFGRRGVDAEEKSSPTHKYITPIKF